MYTVLERATSIIRDVWILASDYGIAGEDCTASFQKNFRRRFDRALRERHRVAHAHEAPSMRSRAINVANRAKDLPAELIASSMETLVSTIMDNLLGELAHEERAVALGNIQKAMSAENQEGRYLTEAGDALDMIRQCLRKSIKRVPVDSQASLGDAHGTTA